MGKLWHRRVAISALLVIIITCATVILVNSYYTSKAPVLISTMDVPTLTVDIRGEVARPGFYELKLGYEIGDVITAAGGYTQYAAPDAISSEVGAKNRTYIYIPSIGEAPQRININTADSWLLDALPGIGATLAERIVSYRGESGPFMSTDEIVKVSGIGASTFDKIRNFIIV